MGIQDKNGADDARKRALKRDFDRAVWRSKLAIYTEKVWDKTGLPFAAGGLFTSASLFGLWAHIPPHLRAGGVGLFATAMAAAAAPLVYTALTGWPSRREALARLDAKTGLPHRPATQFGDRLAAAQTAEETAALWEQHRESIQSMVGTFRAGAPKINDAFHIRLATAVLMAAAAYLAPAGQYQARLADAFDWTEKLPVETATPVTAWITPPAYTGQPPDIFAKSDAPKLNDSRDFTVPAGSVLTLDIYNDPLATVTVDGAGADQKAAASPPLPNVTERTLVLNGNTNVYIQGRAGTSLTWRFNVTPDAAPTVTIDGPPAIDPVPQGLRPGPPKLPYTIGDDRDGAVLTQGTISSPNARTTGDPREAKPQPFPMR